MPAIAPVENLRVVGKKGLGLFGWDEVAFEPTSPSILDNGWAIKIGRGLDIYQRPENWYSIGASDFDLRPCLETMVDIYRE